MNSGEIVVPGFHTGRRFISVRWEDKVEQPDKQKRKDVKLAVDVLGSLIEVQNDDSFDPIEKAQAMTTIILATILKVRKEYVKGGDGG